MYNKLLLNLTIVIGVLVFCEKLTAQVNLQSGSATFSLPMFNWQDPKSRLSDAISLNYNSGNGLKVDDIASNVGTGWNLMAGGVITRMQVGEPDDQMRYDGNSTIGDLSKYPSGYLYNPIDTKWGCPKLLKFYPIFSSENQIYKQNNPSAADRELDYFSFQFNGRGGMFVLDKSKFLSGEYVGIVLGESRLQIKFEIDNAIVHNGLEARTTITSFSIKDENGITYIFKQKTFTKVLRRHYCKADFKTIGNSPSPGPLDLGFHEKVYQETDFDELTYRPYVINSWALTEIKDDVSGRFIQINYNELDISNTKNLYISTLTDNRPIHRDHMNATNYVVISKSKCIEHTFCIKSISYPNGYKVTFKYDDNIYNGKTSRRDLNGAKTLLEIVFELNKERLYSYELATSYFVWNQIKIPQTVSDINASRLCLKSVKKVSSNSKITETPFLFEYFLGGTKSDDFVPPPNYYIRDIGNYYNGDKANILNTSSDIPYNDEVQNLSFQQLRALCFIDQNFTKNFDTYNSGYAKNGLLKKIYYPLGGSLNYEYEQNKFNKGGVNSIVPGVHVSKTILKDGGYSSGILNTQTTIYDYADDNGISTLWGINNPENYKKFHSEINPEDSYLDCNVFTGIGTMLGISDACKCDYHIKHTGIPTSESAQSIGGSQNLGLALANYFVNVGINIGIQAAIGSQASVDIYSIIAQVIIRILFFIWECNLPANGIVDNFTYSNYDYNLSVMYPIGFKRVNVFQLDENGNINGKMVYEFTNESDYALWPETDNPYSMKQRFAPWAYGLIKFISTFDNTGKKVSEIENVYSFSSAKIDTDPNKNNQSCNCWVTSQYSKNSTDWFSNNNFLTANNYSTQKDGDMSPKVYSVFSGRVPLIKTYKRSFKSGSNSVKLEESISYEYNSINFLVKKIIEQHSDGNKLIKENYYAEDFTSNDYKYLVNNNVLNVPVAMYSSIIEKGTTIPKYLGASITEFTQSGLIKPLKLFSGKTTSPINFTFDKSVPKNFPNLKLVQSYAYDAQGLLIGITDEGNRQVTNIYDKEGMHVVATISNASPTMDNPLYTSFEETNNFNNWGVLATSGGASNFSYTSQSITGKQALTLNSNYYLKGQITNSANKDYTLTFWATRPLTVDIYNGAVKVKALNPESSTIPSVNGFQYYEYHITANMATDIQIAGNGNIDELRLFPTTAQMKTSSFDDVLGKISSCDENNRIMYYEYDMFHRLYMIKDEKKNVLKMYEYNTKE